MGSISPDMESLSDSNGYKMKDIMDINDDILSSSNHISTTVSIDHKPDLNYVHNGQLVCDLINGTNCETIQGNRPTLLTRSISKERGVESEQRPDQFAPISLDAIEDDALQDQLSGLDIDSGHGTETLKTDGLDKACSESRQCDSDRSDDHQIVETWTGLHKSCSDRETRPCKINLSEDNKGVLNNYACNTTEATSSHAAKADVGYEQCVENNDLELTQTNCASQTPLTAYSKIDTSMDGVNHAGCNGHAPETHAVGIKLKSETNTNNEVTDSVSHAGIDGEHMQCMICEEEMCSTVINGDDTSTASCGNCNTEGDLSHTGINDQTPGVMQDSDVKHATDLPMCSHLICNQCKEDYILTDPDDPNGSQYKCPFCVH